MSEQRIRWWQDARFGMFIHWGLYSATNLECWIMHNAGIPSAEYAARFAPKFTARNFDADALMAEAKRAGFKYVVMGTRHHEGYCLWDTDTTSFSSAKGTPRRDLIGEYTRAARKAGLRVGLYYSLMDWRSPGFWSGPKKDPRGWAMFVEKVHQQVRELVTRYGRIDVMWYDGAGPAEWRYWDVQPTIRPGPVSDEIAGWWRSAELDAMVRRLQPGILINNRSYVPGDFGTPESQLLPEPRPWEMCDAMGDFWGYSTADRNRKTVRQILHYLIGCVQRGGNFLVNVGPRPDGDLPAWQHRHLKRIGEWMDVHGEAIYGCGGVTGTPLPGGLDIWKCTRKGGHLYLHILRWPGRSFGMCNLHSLYFESATLLDTGKPVRIAHEPTRYVFSGLPDKSPDDIAAVIKVKVHPMTAAERRKCGLIAYAAEADCWT